MTIYYIGGVCVESQGDFRAVYQGSFPTLFAGPSSGSAIHVFQGVSHVNSTTYRLSFNQIGIGTSTLDLPYAAHEVAECPAVESSGGGVADTLSPEVAGLLGINCLMVLACAWCWRAARGLS